MIGQKKLLEQLNKINSLDELPKSIIITGESGCGKHTFVNEISTKFNIPYEEIDYEISPELLASMYELHISKFYLIDFDKLSNMKHIDRFQNTILKFIEEPPQFAWIVLLISYLDDTLETIKNRCQIYSLAPYSLQELRDIATAHNISCSDEILRMLQTPRNIVEADLSEVEILIQLSNLLLDSLRRATPANALALRNKFFSKDAYNYDLDLFIHIFTNILLQRYLATNSAVYVNVLLLTNTFKKNLKVMLVDPKDLMDNWLLKIKGELSNV